MGGFNQWCQIIPYDNTLIMLIILKEIMIESE